MLVFILAVIIGFFCGAVGAFLSYKLGAIFSLIDKPNERSSHSIATPRGGGVGIWLSFLVVGFLLIEPDYRPLIFIAGCIGLLGLIDDRFEISSKIRLLLQLILSSVIVMAYANITFFAHPASFLFFVFFVIFIAGTANFYNFMDGINGIAGLSGIVGFGLTALFLFYFTNEKSIILLALALASACLGFLPFNFPYAKVFMGDVGSVFLGFVFASFVIKSSSDARAFLCLIMFLSTFYGDALLTIYYRWKRGENLMKAHRSHLYQYLSNELGIAHWKVSILYAIIQMMIGLLSIVVYKAGISWQVVFISGFFILFVFVYRRIKSQVDFSPRKT